MEPSWLQSDSTAGVGPVEPIKRPEHTPSRGRRGHSNGSGHYGGIHLRRDKRYPLSQRITPDLIPTAPPAQLPLQADPLRSWKEAVMLWLSWNSTYEKVTARMCKPGQDQKKIEALMDEMDQLRRRAIEISEKLLS